MRGFGDVIPFFLPPRVCLLPDERSQRRCSPSSDNFADLNPSFNENFVFQVRYAAAARFTQPQKRVAKLPAPQCVMRSRPN